jgi:hypothetical protein
MVLKKQPPPFHLVVFRFKLHLLWRSKDTRRDDGKRQAQVQPAVRFVNIDESWRVGCAKLSSCNWTKPQIAAKRWFVIAPLLRT